MMNVCVMVIENLLSWDLIRQFIVLSWQHCHQFSFNIFGVGGGSIIIIIIIIIIITITINNIIIIIIIMKGWFLVEMCDDWSWMYRYPCWSSSVYGVRSTYFLCPFLIYLFFFRDTPTGLSSLPFHSCLEVGTPATLRLWFFLSAIKSSRTKLLYDYGSKMWYHMTHRIGHSIWEANPPAKTGPYASSPRLWTAQRGKLCSGSNVYPRLFQSLLRITMATTHCKSEDFSVMNRLLNRSRTYNWTK